MSTADHVFLKTESSFGTFNTPSASFPVISVANNPGVNFMEQRESGISSGLSDAALGARKPSGTISMVATPENMGILIDAMLNNINSKQVAATTAYTHVFEPNDDAALNSFSMQLQRIGAGTTIATNIRGCRTTRIRIESSVEQFVMVTFDYVAVEELTAGGTFADTNSSPAAITPSYATPIEKHSFLSGVVNYDTPANTTSDGTSDVWSQSGATQLTNVESFMVEFNWNMTQRIFLDSAYPGKIVHGNFDVTGSITLDNDVPSTTWYAFLLAGTKKGIDWKTTTVEEIETNHNYELQVTIPNAQIRAANPFADINGDTSPRSQQIDFTGVVNTTENVSGAIYLKDSNTAY